MKIRSFGPVAHSSISLVDLSPDTHRAVKHGSVSVQIIPYGVRVMTTRRGLLVVATNKLIKNTAIKDMFSKLTLGLDGILRLRSKGNSPRTVQATADLLMTKNAPIEPMVFSIIDAVFPTQGLFSQDRSRCDAGYNHAADRERFIERAIQDYANVPVQAHTDAFRQAYGSDLIFEMIARKRSIDLHDVAMKAESTHAGVLLNMHDTYSNGHYPLSDTQGYAKEPCVLKLTAYNREVATIASTGCQPSLFHALFDSEFKGVVCQMADGETFPVRTFSGNAAWLVDLLGLKVGDPVIISYVGKDDKAPKRPMLVGAL